MRWSESFSTYHTSVATLPYFLLGFLHRRFCRYRIHPGTSANDNLILALQLTADIHNIVLFPDLSSLIKVHSLAPSPPYMDAQASSSGDRRSSLRDSMGPMNCEADERRYAKLGTYRFSLEHIKKCANRRNNNLNVNTKNGNCHLLCLNIVQIG